MKITYKTEIKDRSVTTKEIIEILLKNRNIKDRDVFLKPPDPTNFTLKDFGFGTRIIEKAMKILKEVKEKDQTIVVYTDYDADGITGGAQLWETLHLLGFKVMPYVPHRKHEGYGFSKLGIDNVKRDFDPALIISVDHGIAAVEQIKYAKSLGIKVIVTDHHNKQEKIPEDAEAIFHIPALSGSGTAYFFAKEVFEHFRHAERSEESRMDPSLSLRMTANLKQLAVNFKHDYLALASIGTIADLVPLVGQSRSVVTYGLKAFPFVRRYGIRHIVKEAGIEGKEISPFEIGFIIAPRINAVGRLEHAIDALRLLCTTNDARARELAGKVGQKNVERRDLVKINVQEAMGQIEKMLKKGDLPKIIILHSPKWHEGVIGLIASNVLEKYYRPTIVMSESDGQLKGSARSIPSFHITKFFEELKEYFLNFGGHAGAAGFTMEKKKLEKFIKAAEKLAGKQIKDSDLEKKVEVDIKIPVSIHSLSLAKAIESLKPFGIGNSQPSFASEVEIVSAKLLGKTNDHLKLLVKDPEGNGFPIEMVAFKKGDLFKSLSRGQKIMIIYQLDINRWNGRETLQGKIQHFYSAEDKLSST